MTVTIVNQTLRIDGVTSTTVSDIEEDTENENGGFVRRIEYYTDALNTTNRRPVLTVMLYGETEAALELITPNLRF